MLLSLGASPAGDALTGTTFSIALVVAMAALLGAGLAARAAGPVLLGWLAGLGYAGSALAVRGVELPLSVPSAVAAVTVPGFGVVAFWLYSLALDRSMVSTATAPMITAQTFVPALVGLAWLGDDVRDGWGLAIGAGLLLATAGTVPLARASAAGAGRAG